MNKRSTVLWVPIEYVVPNSLNPRRNDAIRTEEMQEIILNKGWEIPLTCYKKGSFYVILSGHRRLFAAKQTRSIKELPVYLVTPPENQQEEIERIASLQRGQVDWSQYEWAKFTYERWCAWGKPPLPEFARKRKITLKQMKQYVQIMEFYPRDEIEYKTELRVYNVSTLDALASFIIRLRKAQPDLVANLTLEMVRQQMLKKVELKLVHRDTLVTATKYLIPEITSDDFIKFMTDTSMSLVHLLDMYNIDPKPSHSFKGRLISVGRARKTIEGFPVPRSTKDRDSLEKALKNIKETVDKRLKELDQMDEKTQLDIFQEK